MHPLQSIECRERASRLRRNLLASHLAGERVLLALARLRALVEKAGFNPDQPRLPPGGPGGGQWNYEEGYAQGQKPGIGHNEGPTLDPPEPPKDPPKDKVSKTQAAKALAKEIARRALRRAGPIGAAITVIDIGHRLYSEYPSIRSYQDKPATLGELQENVGKRRSGYEDHHIVERSAGKNENFPDSMISGADNLVSVPKYKHHEISGWYGTKNPRFGGLSPREYLRGKSWSEQVQMGHYALRKFGVLK